MTYKAIIFDLDGVIIHTEHLHFKAYKLALKAYDINLTEDMYNKNLRSQGRVKGLSKLINDISEAQIQSIGSEKDTHFLKLLEENQEVIYQDALELMMHCKGKNMTLGLATASYKGRLVLEKLNLIHFFDYIVTGQDVENNKPDPEIYNTCKAFINCEDQDILVIEDSKAGIQAGLNAHLKVAYVQREDQALESSYLLKHQVLHYSSLITLKEDLF